MLSHDQAILTAKATINPDESEALALEYFVCMQTGSEDEVLYGLRVDKRHLDGGLIEREETPALTGSLAEAKALAETFAAGTVPPSVLLEMVDEWHESSLPSCKHTTGEENFAAGF